MEIQIRKEDDITIASPSGRVDVHTREEFLHSILQLFTKDCHNVLMDCSGIDYMNSAGVRAILEISDHAKTLGGKLTLCAPADALRDLFQTVHIETHVQVFTTQEDALKALT